QPRRCDKARRVQSGLQHPVAAQLDSLECGFKIETHEFGFVGCVETIPEPVFRIRLAHIIEVVQPMQHDIVAAVLPKTQPAQQVLTTVERAEHMKPRNKENAESTTADRFADPTLFSSR